MQRCDLRGVGNKVLTSPRVGGLRGNKLVKSNTIPLIVIQQSIIVQCVPTSAAVYHLSFDVCADERATFQQFED